MAPARGSWEREPRLWGPRILGRGGGRRGWGIDDKTDPIFINRTLDCRLIPSFRVPGQGLLRRDIFLILRFPFRVFVLPAPAFPARTASTRAPERDPLWAGKKKNGPWAAAVVGKWCRGYRFSRRYDAISFKQQLFAIPGEIKTQHFPLRWPEFCLTCTDEAPDIVFCFHILFHCCLLQEPTPVVMHPALKWLVGRFHDSLGMWTLEQDL